MSKKQLVLVIVLSLIISFSLAATGALLHSRFEETDRKREIQAEVNRQQTISNQKQNQSLRLFICLLQRTTNETRNERTPAEQRRADAFFKEALANIDAKPCGRG